MKQAEYQKYLQDDTIEGDRNLDDIFPVGHFIESSHVKFLEAAGARVIPIDYERPYEELKKLFSQINGLYIPGDSKSLVNNANKEFAMTIRKITKWAQIHNEKESQHFPILGVGYGMMAMLKSQINELQGRKEFDKFVARGKLQQNLAHDPKNTYLFDEFTKD